MIYEEVIPNHTFTMWRAFSNVVLLITSVAILISQATPLAIKNDCEKKCSCSDFINHVDTVCKTSEDNCSEKHPSKTNLYGTRLTQVKTTFPNEITRLDLSNCNLEFVSPGAFQDLNSMQELDLSGNKISGLTPGHFENLPSLHVIRMNGNARNECRKLRKALPGIKFICGPHVIIGTSSRETDVGEVETSSTTTEGSTAEGRDVFAAGEGVGTTWWSGFFTGFTLVVSAGLLVAVLIFARKNLFKISGQKRLLESEAGEEGENNPPGSSSEACSRLMIDRQQE